ncbi:MAG: hypothetical protein KatS3mg104_2939 [Phycisphaerae bacterium]|nr:MAG: hypothetical protein KatS3mg104_2939 [Phycisphaerae bacterium]
MKHVKIYNTNYYNGISSPKKICMVSMITSIEKLGLRINISVLDCTESSSKIVFRRGGMKILFINKSFKIYEIFESER